MEDFEVLGELFELVNPLEIEAFLLVNTYVYNQLIALRGVLYEKFGGQFALQVAETIDGEIIFLLFQPLYAKGCAIIPACRFLPTQLPPAT